MTAADGTRSTEVVVLLPSQLDRALSIEVETPPKSPYGNATPCGRSPGRIRCWKHWRWSIFDAIFTAFRARVVLSGPGLLPT